MLNMTQGGLVVGLVRKKARVLRGEKLRPLRLMHSLIMAGEALIPDQYLLPFASSLSRILENTPYDQDTLPNVVGSLINKNLRCRKENLETLERFAERIKREFQSASHHAVLAGDVAALAGLYGDAGAFPVTECSALLSDGRYANGSRPKEMLPPAEEWSEVVPIGTTPWRRAKPAFMIALFARHIGDASASPTLPVWPHLGAALLLWKDRIGVEEILHLGVKLGQNDEVERGLAIIARIFPELKAWVKPEKLSIPKWERKYAVPIAARRIMIGRKD
jgi:hypothetical protein